MMKKKTIYIFGSAVVLLILASAILFQTQGQETGQNYKYYIDPMINSDTSYEFIYNSKTYHCNGIYSLNDIQIGEPIREESSFHKENTNIINNINMVTGSSFSDAMYSINNADSELFLAYFDKKNQKIMVLEQDNDFGFDSVEDYLERYDLFSAKKIYVMTGLKNSEGQEVWSDKKELSDDESEYILEMMKKISNREINESLAGNIQSANYRIIFEYSNGIQVQMPLYLNGLKRFFLGDHGFYVSLTDDEGEKLIKIFK